MTVDYDYDFWGTMAVGYDYGLSSFIVNVYRHRHRHRQCLSSSLKGL